MAWRLCPFSDIFPAWKKATAATMRYLFFAVWATSALAAPLTSITGRDALPASDSSMCDRSDSYTTRVFAAITVC
jgi:hypothetical protein